MVFLSLSLDVSIRLTYVLHDDAMRASERETILDIYLPIRRFPVCSTLPINFRVNSRIYVFVTYNQDNFTVN